MKILLSKYLHTIVWYNKKYRKPYYKQGKQPSVGSKTPARWAEYAKNNHYGDLFACQLIFLGAISQERLDDFFEKVRDKIDATQQIARPTERELEIEFGQDRIGTGLQPKFWYK